ncbi:MAG: hypothetical protein PHV34_16590 [Verrucomicrobiae bacterium]|nr:hypothetical protein [Verrucomicrobiae bacterium]
MSAPLVSRPETAAEVAEGARRLDLFGRAIRDWQHELRRISSRRDLAGRLMAAPRLLRRLFKDGEIADAYLAGYVCFLADKAKIKRPDWACAPLRVAKQPWFSREDRKRLLVVTPGALREHNIFAEPENVVAIRTGRPSKTDGERRQTNAARQRRYRQRVREKLKELRRLRRVLNSEGNPKSQ